MEQPWYKTAIIYEVYVRSFMDSNADGIGDFNGLTSKLDYLADLGVTALWLLPFYPSPLRDGGYDIADYTDIHPAYGTLDDFKRFLEAAKERGLRVITELVVNHTSSEHDWFRRSRAAPRGSVERDFYVWSDTPDRYGDARIIFKDFEASNWSYDPVARQYYWHRFYSHQPDLNFDNPAVTEALLNVVDTWFGLGVDGMRLDAVPYLFERERTSCENLPETHGFLKRLRAHVDARFTDRMLLAEANQWPVDAASYFGNGDECHMNFHFPLMPRMFMSVEMEDRFPIIDILRQTPNIPDSCQWATFLRNHDELTLEMVTDEERDYMYNVYSEDPVARINLGIRRRLAPLVKSRRKFELMNVLLFSLPGTPVLYYGDEIGMGDNIYLGDRDGVRTPMQWSADRNAGFSRANPQRLYMPIIIDPEYHYEAINVEAQEQNASSLLRWTKRLLDVRRQTPVLGTGALKFVTSDNSRVLSFIRHDDETQILCVANLSRHAQHVTLDLEGCVGVQPVEMFGRARFPTVVDRSYTLALGPHGYYWFRLEREKALPDAAPLLRVRGTWTAVFDDATALADALGRYIAPRRWYRSKARTLVSPRIVDTIRSAETGADGMTVFVVWEGEYADGTRERYLVPLACASGARAAAIEATAPHAVVAHLTIHGAAPEVGASPDGAIASAPPAVVLYDALASGDAARLLVELVRDGATLKGARGELTTAGAADVRAAIGDELGPSAPGMLEQTNTTVTFGERLVLKVVRTVEGGENAELELGHFLRARARAGLVPTILGSIGYQERSTRVHSTIGVLHAYVPNQGTGWQQVKGDLENVMERLLSERVEAPIVSGARGFDLIDVAPPESVSEHAGRHLHHARQLGIRIAELHNVLGGGTEASFAPEPFTVMHQQSLYQSARALLIRTFETLEARMREFPEATQELVADALTMRPRLDEQLSRVVAQPLQVLRVRCHGDLHLGQVLATGDDFVIIDFEGEPARPLRERRYKRCTLRDVASMLRSFDYVGEAALRSGRVRTPDAEQLRTWIAAWTKAMCGAFLQTYTATLTPALMPAPDARALLLDFYTTEKCIYEVGYELNNRPSWLNIPLAGLASLLPTDRTR